MRRKKNKKSKKIRRQRDIYNITKTGGLLTRQDNYDSIIRKMDDKRYYHPDGKYRRDLKINGTEAKIKLSTRHHKKNRFLKDPLKAKLVYKDPLRTMECIRRKERRETLFNKGIIGKGKKGSGNRRRMTIRSKIKC